MAAHVNRFIREGKMVDHSAASIADESGKNPKSDEGTPESKSDEKPEEKTTLSTPETTLETKSTPTEQLVSEPTPPVVLEMERILQGRLGDMLDAAYSLNTQEGFNRVRSIERFIEMQFSQMILEKAEARKAVENRNNEIVESLAQQLEDLKTQMDALTEDIEQEKNELQQQVGSLRRELTVVKSKYARSRRSMSYTMEKKAAAAEFSGANDSFEDLEKQVADLKEKNANLADRIAVREKNDRMVNGPEDISITEQRNRAHRLLDAYRQKEDTYKDEVTRLTQENATLQNTIRTIQQVMEKK